MFSELSQDLERYCRDVRSCESTLHNMHWMTDRRRENLRRVPIIAVYLHNVLDELNAVGGDVVETPDERGNVVCTGLCGKQCLAGGEAQRHVYLNILGAERPACF